MQAEEKFLSMLFEDSLDRRRMAEYGAGGYGFFAEAMTR